MIKAHNLGKSCIIDHEINSAYDTVEYLAKNLPVIVDLASRVELLKAFEPIVKMLSHIEDTKVHLSDEQIEAIEKVQEVLDSLASHGETIKKLTDDLCKLCCTMNEHIDDKDIHITAGERTKWNNYANQIANMINASTSLEHSLANVAISGDYNDLVNKPVIPTFTVDNNLDSYSSNAVKNSIVTNALNNKVETSALAKVAFTGNYSDLMGIPKGDDELDYNSDNWVTNKAITKALGDVQSFDILTNADIDVIIANLGGA